MAQTSGLQVAALDTNPEHTSFEWPSDDSAREKTDINSHKITIYQPGETLTLSDLDDLTHPLSSVKEVLQKHLAGFGISDVFEMPAHATANSVKDVMESAIRRQHTDQLTRQFDFSTMFESLDSLDSSTDVMMTLTLSHAKAGKLLAMSGHDVEIAYDGNLGIMTISGTLNEVQAFVRDLYFHADVNELKNFWIDIQLIPTDGQTGDQTQLIQSFETVSARMVMLYDQGNGFYVAKYQGSGDTLLSSGTARLDDPIEITAPDNTQMSLSLRQLPESQQSLFLAEQATVPMIDSAPSLNTPTVIRESLFEQPDVASPPPPTVDTAVPEPVTSPPASPPMQAPELADSPEEPLAAEPVPGPLFTPTKPGSPADPLAPLDTEPVAADDLYGTAIDNVLTIDATNGATGLLDNDNDTDNDPLTITAFDGASTGGGTIIDNGDGTFNYTPALGFTGADTFTYTIEDDDGNSSTATVTVSVVNNPPVNTVPTAQATQEETALTFNTGGGNAISIAEADGGNPISVTLSVNDGILTLGNLAGIAITAGANASSSITFSGTLTDINTALNGLSYTPDLDHAGADTLSITSNDGNGGIDTDTVAISVSNINDAPVIDNSGGMNLSPIAENDFTNGGTSIVDIVASSAANGGNAISDTDSGAVEGIAVTSVDNANGTWEYNTGAGWSAIAGVNGSNALLLGPTDSIRFVPDLNYNGLGGDITFHAWDQTSGIAGGFGDPSSNGGSTAFSTATETATILISNVNTAPTFTNFGDSALTIIETQAQSGTQLIDSAVTVSDLDSANFDGGQLTVTYSAAGIATDQLSVLNVGNNPGEIGFDGTTVSFGGTAIATINGVNSGANGADLVLDLTANTTPAMLELLIEHLTFSTTNEVHDSTRTVEVTFTDGDGGTSPTRTIDITVTDESETYVFTAGDDSFLGGTANDTISGDADDWGVNDVIDLGGATGTVNLTDAGTTSIGTNISSPLTINLADNGAYNVTVANAPAASLAIVGGLLTAGHSLTVDANAFTNNMTITSGVADDAVTIGSGAYDIQTGDGSDTISIRNGTIQADVSIDGGTGSDTLVITDNANIVFAELANISGIDQINLTSNISRLQINDAFVNGTDHGDQLIINNGTFTINELRTSTLTGPNEVIITGTGQVRLSNNDHNAVRIQDGVDGDIYGSNQRDSIYGGSGDDVINSRNDHDSILGGAGDDSIRGGINNDTIRGGADNDTILGENNNDQLFGDDGNDSINAGRHHDSVDGGDGNDTILGDRENDTLLGGDGDDTIDGGQNNDYLTGGLGADTLTGGTNIDRFIYTDVSESTALSMDIITDFELLNDKIDITALGALNYIDNESFTGTANELRWDLVGPDLRLEVDHNADGTADMVVLINGLGTTGINLSNFIGTLNDVSAPVVLNFTNAINDSLIGEEGSTVFQTTNADFNATDTADGGIGDDRIEFSDAANIVLGDWANKQNIETIVLGAAGNLIEISDAFVESAFNDRVTLQNGNFDVTLNASNLTGAERILIGGSGQITLADGVDNENVYGVNGVRANIAAGSGNDEIFGANQQDSLSGGGGNDIIYSYNGNDTIDGGDGNDQLRGGNNHDSIDGGDGNDTIYGDNNNDTIDGGDGNDTIYGGNHNDSIRGGLGNDSIRGDNNNDTIDAGDGNDTVNGGRHNDSILGGIGNDSLFGERNNDTLRGGDGNDTLNGDRNNDLLDGGIGDDTLHGGREQDVMTGGAGDDVFDFDATNHSANNGSRDRITDFGDGNDVIDLAGFAGVFTVASADGAGNGAADFTGSGNMEIAWEVVGADMIVYLDTSGNGASNSQIQLDGVLTLSGGDFIL